MRHDPNGQQELIAFLQFVLISEVVHIWRCIVLGMERSICVVCSCLSASLGRHLIFDIVLTVLVVWRVSSLELLELRHGTACCPSLILVIKK